MKSIKNTFFFFKTIKHSLVRKFIRLLHQDLQSKLSFLEIKKRLIYTSSTTKFCKIWSLSSKNKKKLKDWISCLPKKIILLRQFLISLIQCKKLQQKTLIITGERGTLIICWNRMQSSWLSQRWIMTSRINNSLNLINKSKHSHSLTILTEKNMGFRR